MLKTNFQTKAIDPHHAVAARGGLAHNPALHDPAGLIRRHVDLGQGHTAVDIDERDRHLVHGMEAVGDANDLVSQGNWTLSRVPVRYVDDGVLHVCIGINSRLATPQTRPQISISPTQAFRLST